MLFICATLVYVYRYRSFYIAEAYAALKKWPESLALFDALFRYAADAKKALKDAKISAADRVS